MQGTRLTILDYGSSILGTEHGIVGQDDNKIDYGNNI